MKTKQLNSRIVKYLLSSWTVILMVLILSTYPARTVEPAYIRYDSDIPKDYEIKAVYLYNFLQFVHWPEDKCDLPGGRAREIVVLGESSVKEVLLNLQAKLRESEKDLYLTFYKSYHKDTDLSDCCLIFISDSELDHLPEILDKLAGRPVLTVADSEAFWQKGTMITLISRQNKVRWAINRRPVKESGLRLSAKLLDIAVQVAD